MLAQIKKKKNKNRKVSTNLKNILTLNAVNARAEKK